jgi:hypothetical protein
MKPKKSMLPLLTIILTVSLLIGIASGMKNVMAVKAGPVEQLAGISQDNSLNSSEGFLEHTNYQSNDTNEKDPNARSVEDLNAQPDKDPNSSPEESPTE